MNRPLDDRQILRLGGNLKLVALGEPIINHLKRRAV